MKPVKSDFSPILVPKVFLNDLGIVNALGLGCDVILENLLKSASPGIHTISTPLSNEKYLVAEVIDELPTIPIRLNELACKNNQLILAALNQIEDSISLVCRQYSPERIGVVMGSSTSGVVETEKALSMFASSGEFPDDYQYIKQEAGSVSEFVAQYYSVKGPTYTISTACSSSGKVFASARSLIESNLCDAVIVGGADSLCDLTLQGFAALEATSNDHTNPFSINRKGINIGEGAAIFLMTREPSRVSLCGVGESSDAYHMSAPEPSGEGAKAAMLAALADASLKAGDIDYINLHGTGTKLNDAMESHAVYSIFQDKVMASSTKPLTGHTLGAAGAIEAGLCWMLLSMDDARFVAPHMFDGKLDPALSKINLCTDISSPDIINYMMSNSFAFGGSNVSVILGRNND